MARAIFPCLPITLKALESAQDEAALEGWRVAHLGRTSSLMLVFDKLGSLPKDERPGIGRRANEVKRRLETALAERAENLRQMALRQALQAERLDVTPPGRRMPRGRIHHTTQALRDAIGAFAEMGFQVYRSPEVESDDYNFGLLNIPPHHPARDLWDTFHTTTPGYCCARIPHRDRYT